MFGTEMFGIDKPRAESKKIAISEEHIDELHAMSQSDRELNIKMACCASRLKNAIDSGSESMALSEFEQLCELKNESTANHSQMWSRIQKLYPQTTEGNWSLDGDSMTLKPSESGISDLLRMLGSK